MTPDKLDTLIYPQSVAQDVIDTLRELVPDFDAIVPLTESVPGMFGLLEMNALGYAATLAPKGSPFVELGPYHGRSTIILSGIAKRCGHEVVTIDNFSIQRMVLDPTTIIPSSVEIIERNVAPTGANVRVIEGPSHVVPEGIGEVGLLFIDTDHRAECLNRELDAWLPLMLPRSVIALHDYCILYPDLIEVMNRRLGLSDEWRFVALLDKLIVFWRTV